MPNLYGALFVLAVSYAVLLYSVNLIPHISIKYIGFLSLRGVTIKFRTTTVYIGKVALQINAFGPRDESLKWISLMLMDVNVTCLKGKSVKNLHAETSQKHKTLSSDESIKNKLQFHVPTFIYNYLLRTELINKINFIIVRASIYHQSTHERFCASLEFTRFETKISKCNNLRLTATLFNGFIFENENRDNKLDLFRNVEFFVNCTVITSCDVNKTNRIRVNFEEFRTSLSIGRLNIPMEYISTKKQTQPKHDSTSESSTLIEDDSPNQITDVMQYKDLLEDLMSLYSLTEIRLEDFTLSYENVSINLSNFVFSLEKVVKPTTTSTLKLHIYVTSFKFFHLDTKCVELPSGTVTYEVCPMNTLRVSQALLNHDENSNEDINFKFGITLANPVLDVYYDQEDILFGVLRDKMMRKRMNKMRTAAGVHQKDEAMKKLKLASKMLKDVSTKIVIVDTKLNIHLPRIGSTREDIFNRHSSSNTTVSFSVTDLTHRIFTRTQTRAVKGKGTTESHTINSFFKIKNFRGEADGNLAQLTKINLLLAYDLDRGKMSVRLSSKAINFKSANDIFFYLVRQFRNRQRIYFNKKFDEWLRTLEKNGAPDQPNKAERLSFGDLNNPIGENQEDELIKIFEVLPPYVSSVKMDLSSLVFEIKSKEELPSHKIYDYRIGKEIDLKDYRRGISLRMTSFSGVYKRAQEHVQLSVGLVQAATLSEYTQEYMISNDEVNDSESSDSELDDVSTINTLDSTPTDSNVYGSDGLGNTDTYGVKNVLTIQNINVVNDSSKSEDRDPNNLILTIPEIDGHVDTFFLWCIFYAKTLLHRFAPTVETNCTKEQMKQITGPKKKVKLDVLLESVTVSVRLPHNVDVLLEFDRSRLQNVFVLKNADVKNIRMYVIHPSTKLWARIVVVKEAKFSIDVSKTLHEAAFELHTKSILFNVPNRFAIYTVIDNTISLVKAIKQLSHNFKYFNYGVDKFERVYPVAKNALVFPHVRIKTSALGLALENDPFEHELAMIFELGKIEQRVRQRKVEAFEAKCREIRANVKPDIEEQVELSDLPGPLVGSRKGSFRKAANGIGSKQSPLRNEATYHDDSSVNEPRSSNESTRKKFKGTFMRRRRHHTNQKNNNDDAADSEAENEPRLTKAQAEKEIKEAHERLKHNFSLSWIRKFKSFKDVRNKGWKERREELWGKDDPTDIMKSKYDIVEYADGPTLTTALFLDVDLTLDKFRGGDVDEFLYTYAKKQPKQNYSISVPLYIELTARSFHMFLKDYPLPLASFPSNSNPQIPTVHIKSNLVVNEHLYKRKEELRYIYVPFSWAVFDNGVSDNFYSVYIPRTLTTVKFAADFQCDLNTDRACIVGWSKSYQPAIGTMTQAFENFSKPAIDDSPIGIWDKIPLIMHGKYKFNIANELCLHMKSGRSPYKLVGLDAGFVFNWKNNVDLTIDGTIDPKRLVVITSDDFIFAVPNYSVHEKHTWSLYYDGRGGFEPSSDPEGKKYHKRVIRLSTNDRVEWCLGMMFERNKHFSHRLSDQEERTSEFLPHHKVQITNPANEYHPDSYDGYRADYVHMALSVISRSHNGQAFNAAFLTPLAFHHFFYWWDTVAHYSPLPVRSGKLFSDGKKKPKIKLSPHLFTVKYQMIFNPVTISHLYIHSSNEVHEKKNRVAFTGLKGKFDVCEIDLHQRKQLMTYVNQKLNMRTQVKHLKMNQAEINVEGADVRILNALFPDQSVSGRLLSYLTGDHVPDSSSGHQHGPMHASKFSKWIESVDVPDGDLSWVDPEDFIELEVNEPLSAYPKIRILPFFATPKLSYFREFTLHEDGPYPFGNEKIHDFIMDTEKPSGVQSRILAERVEILKGELSRKKQQLTRMKSQNIPKNEQHAGNVETDIQLLEEKIDVINEAHKNFTEEDLKMTNNFDDPEHLTPLSKQHTGLSAYSSHKDRDELLEAANFVAIAEFHNRFIVHNLQMKWDDDIRVYFVNYLERISDRRNHVYYMTRMAIDLVQNVISESERTRMDDDLNFSDKTFTNFKGGIEAVEGFAEALDVLQNPDVEEAEHKYLIKLIHPQIQMISRKAPDTCVIVTSRDLDIKVVDINQKDLVNILTDSSEVTAKVESRIGVMFREEQIFVVSKDDVSNVGANAKFAKGGYMNSISHWPPWFECEVCYRGAWAQEFLVAERNTVALVYKSPNNLFLNAKNLERHNEVVVFINKFVVNATSSQYSSIYYVITELLLSGETKDSLQSKLAKIVSVTDPSDFKGLDVKVKDLQTAIREYNDLVLTFHQRGATLNDTESKYLQILELEMEKSKLELLLIMKLLGTRNKSKSKETTKFWHILTDQVIWHFLTDNRQPFIDVACTGIAFSRIESIDGANHNDFEIKMLQGFNLQENNQFPILFSPLIPKGETNFDDDGRPVVKMTWDLSALVGGIPIIKHAKLDVLPLRFELDYATAKMLQSYLFPKDDDMDVDDSDDSDDESTYSSSEEAFEDTASEKSSLMTNESKSPWKKLLSRHKPLTSKRSIEQLGSSSNGTSTPSSSAQESHESRLLSSQGSVFGRHQDKSGSSNSNKVTKPRRRGRYTATNTDVLDDEIETLISRSLKYKSIVDIEISNSELMVSFSGPKTLHLLNVNQLILSIPTLQYQYKIWSAEDFTNRLKKDIIKIILSHTGKILGNKLSHKKKMTTAKPLKQISNYEGFLTLEDLQDQSEQQAGHRNSQISPQVSRVHHNKSHSRPHIVRHGPADEETFEAYLDGEDLERATTNPRSDKVAGDVDAA